MATRGRIGLELSDGSILSAYHHWDSYPSWLGKTLVEHYNTYESVSELIDGGDMSVCWTTERWDGLNSHGGQMKTEGKEWGPQYYSGRGEDCPPRVDSSLEKYISKDNNEEYAYVFTSAGWVCYDMNEFNDNDPQVVDIPSD